MYVQCDVGNVVNVPFKDGIREYQGVKEFHMLAHVGCCNIMVFSPFKVKVTYYHPLNLLVARGNQW